EVIVDIGGIAGPEVQHKLFSHCAIAVIFAHLLLLAAGKSFRHYHVLTVDGFNKKPGCVWHLNSTLLTQHTLRQPDSPMIGIDKCTVTHVTAKPFVARRVVPDGSQNQQFRGGTLVLSVTL